MQLLSNMYFYIGNDANSKCHMILWIQDEWLPVAEASFSRVKQGPCSTFNDRLYSGMSMPQSS